jgi:hypothetical protein
MVADPAVQDALGNRHAAYSNTAQGDPRVFHVVTPYHLPTCHTQTL